MSIIITPYQPADLPALRALFLSVRQSTFTWLDTSLYSLTDFDIETEGELISVAKVNDTIAGFISIWLPDNFIHHLYLDHQFRQQGIGSKLLSAALDKLTVPVTLKCLDQNFAAINFYRRHGFVEHSRGESPAGNYILFEHL